MAWPLLFCLCAVLRLSSASRRDRAMMVPLVLGYVLQPLPPASASLTQLCNYFVEPEPMTFAEAQANCESKGATLAEVRSEYEHQELWRIAMYALAPRRTCAPTMAVWLGATNNRGNVVTERAVGVGRANGMCTCPDGSEYAVGEFVSVYWGAGGDQTNHCRRLACIRGTQSDCAYEHGVGSYRMVACGDDAWRWLSDGAEVFPTRTYARWERGHPDESMRNVTGGSCAVARISGSDPRWESVPCEGPKYPSVCRPLDVKAVMNTCPRDFVKLGFGIPNECHERCGEAGMRFASILTNAHKEAALIAANGSHVSIGAGGGGPWHWVDGTSGGEPENPRQNEHDCMSLGPNGNFHAVRCHVYHHGHKWEGPCLCSACSCPVELRPPSTRSDALRAGALPFGQNTRPPPGYVAKPDSAECRCRANETGLDACGELCCAASPFTDPNPTAEHYHGGSPADLCYEPSGASVCGYAVHEEPLSWAGAKASCAASNSSLVEGRTDEERALMWRVAARTLVASDSNCTSSFWVGASDELGDGTWRWSSDSSKVHSAHWQEGRPHNASGTSRCVVASKESGFRWVDVPCDNDGARFAYMCKPRGKTSVDFCPPEVGLPPAPTCGYVAFDDIREWSDARAMCEGLGLTLVEAHSTRETALLWELGRVGQHVFSRSGGMYWLALRSGPMRWSSGGGGDAFTRKGYFPDLNRPHNSLFQDGDCYARGAANGHGWESTNVHHWVRHAQHGLWAEVPCNWAFRVVCQRHVGVLPEECAHPITTICGYAIHSEKKTWSEARESCAAMGGSLAEIRSEEKRQELWRLAAYTLTQTCSREFWLGASSDGGTWRWASDGATLSDHLWGERGPSSTGTEDAPLCGVASADAELVWRSVSCGDAAHKKLAYICELPPDAYESNLCPIEVGSSSSLREVPRAAPAPPSLAPLPVTAQRVCGYIVDTEPKTWAEANASCVALGTSLVEIKSSEEHAMAWRAAAYGLLGACALGFWIGATYTPHDTWRWSSDGALLNFERWAESAYVAGEEEQCAVTGSTSESRWRPYRCTTDAEAEENHLFPYVCQPPPFTLHDEAECPPEIRGYSTFSPTPQPTPMLDWKKSCGYTFVDMPRTHDDAQADCAARGSTLLELRDGDRVDEFMWYAILDSMDCEFWLGGSREQGSKDWSWESDGATIYSPEEGSPHPVRWGYSSKWKDETWHGHQDHSAHQSFSEDSLGYSQYPLGYGHRPEDRYVHYAHVADNDVTFRAYLKKIGVPSFEQAACMSGTFVGGCERRTAFAGAEVHLRDEKFIVANSKGCETKLPYICQTLTSFQQQTIENQKVCPQFTECDLRNRTHCSNDRCSREGFADCLCGTELHEDIVSSAQLGGNPIPWHGATSLVDELQAKLDVPFLNNGIESSFCSRTGINAFPYTAWHRSDHSGFVAASSSVAATKYDYQLSQKETLLGMFDEFGVIVEGALGSGDACREAFREYLCFTLRPQVRFDPAAKGMRTCRVCRDVCAAYMAACTNEDREGLYGLAIAVMPIPRETGDRVCSVGDRRFEVLDRALNAFLFANCTNDFPDSDCTSRSVNSCDRREIPPVALFRNFPAAASLTFNDELGQSAVQLRLDGPGSVLDEVEDGRAKFGRVLVVPPEANLVLTNLSSVLSSASRDILDRADQYTIIMDVQYTASTDGSRSSRGRCDLPFHWVEKRNGSGHTVPWDRVNGYPNWIKWKTSAPSSCLLTIRNDADAPVWPDGSFGKNDGNGRDVLFVDGLSFSGETGGRCSVLGVVEQCLEYEATCGPRIVTGRAQVSPLFLEPAALSQERITNASTLESTWVRVALSVDLVAGYVRVFGNAGGGPRKVADESWVKTALEDAYPQLGMERNAVNDLRATYLNTDGSFALPNEMLVATDCYTTTKLGGLAVYPVALHESTLERLTGPPGSSMSFLLDVSPRSLELHEGTSAPTMLRVRLNHPPLSPAEVSLRLITPRVRVEPATLRFDERNWNTAQEFRLVVINDDLMQRTVLESLEATIVSSEPTAWGEDLDDLVHVTVVDDDIAALIAQFDSAAIRIADASSNRTGSASTANASEGALTPEETTIFKHSFPLPHSWCPPGFTCIDDRSSAQKIGSVEIRGGSTVQYTLRLGSEPIGAVTVAIEVRLEDSDDDPLVVAVPPEITFTPDAWKVERTITLSLHPNATFGGEFIVAHTLEHRLDSADDLQYRTPLSGVLSADLLAVRDLSNATLSSPVSASLLTNAEVGALVVGLVTLVGIVFWLVIRRQRRKFVKVRIKLEKSEFELREEAKKLNEEAAKLKESLQNATKMVEQVMEEGGSVIKTYELNSDDLVYSEPRWVLGEGSFGTVFHAVFRGKHEVAVKTMRVGRVSHTQVSKFKSEIVIMAPLHHENLVRLWGGVWQEGADNLCIVLEYCAKGSLDTFLSAQTENSDWGDVRHGLALGIAKGLSYLHHDLIEPLIHRDVKPGNILVQRDGCAKLADFGESTNFDTATARRSSETDAASMTIVGTKLYCAPEVMLGQRYSKCNESADTFSYALVLLCLVVGDIQYVRVQHRKGFAGQMAYANDWRPVIPKELRESAGNLVDLIEAMWQPDFRRRPNMKQVVSALENTEGLRLEKPFTSVEPTTVMDEIENALIEFPVFSASELDALRHLYREVQAIDGFLTSNPRHVRGAVALLRLVRNPDTTPIERTRLMIAAREVMGSSTKEREIREGSLSLHTIPGSNELRQATWQRNEWTGLSENGDIVVYERFGATSPSIILAQIPIGTFAQWETYRWEARAMMLDALSYRALTVLHCTNVIDLAGLSLEHRKVIPYFREFTGGKAVKAVPTLISTTHIIRSTTAVSMLFSAIRPFMNEHQKSIMLFVRGRNPFRDSRSFATRFGRHVLPSTVGGTLLVGDDEHCCTNVELPAASSEGALWRRYLDCALGSRNGQATRSKPSRLGSIANDPHNGVGAEGEVELAKIHPRRNSTGSSARGLPTTLPLAHDRIQVLEGMIRELKAKDERTSSAQES